MSDVLCPPDTDPVTSTHPCPAGTYGCSGVCDSCSAGSYSYSGWRECSKCPVGWYSAKTRSGTCAACPVDSYADTVGSTTCKTCVAVDRTGASTCDESAEDSTGNGGITSTGGITGIVVASILVCTFIYCLYRKAGQQQPVQSKYTVRRRGRSGAVGSPRLATVAGTGTGTGAMDFNERIDRLTSFRLAAADAAAAVGGPNGLPLANPNPNSLPGNLNITPPPLAHPRGEYFFRSSDGAQNQSVADRYSLDDARSIELAPRAVIHPPPVAPSVAASRSPRASPSPLPLLQSRPAAASGGGSGMLSGGISQPLPPHLMPTSTPASAIQAAETAAVESKDGI